MLARMRRPTQRDKVTEFEKRKIETVQLASGGSPSTKRFTRPDSTCKM